MTIKVTLIFSYSWASKHQIFKAFRADICGIVWTGSYFYLFLSKTFFDIWNLRPLIIVTTNFKVYNTISTSAKNQSLKTISKHFRFQKKSKGQGQSKEKQITLKAYFKRSNLRIWLATCYKKHCTISNVCDLNTNRK